MQGQPWAVDLMTSAGYSLAQGLKSEMGTRDHLALPHSLRGQSTEQRGNLSVMECVPWVLVGRLTKASFLGEEAGMRHSGFHRRGGGGEGKVNQGEQMSGTKAQRAHPQIWERVRLGLRHPRGPKKSQGDKGEWVTVGHSCILKATPP